MEDGIYALKDRIDGTRTNISVVEDHPRIDVLQNAGRKIINSDDYLSFIQETDC